MKYRFIPAFVMLLAGLVCCIMSIVQKWEVTYSLIVLILVLIFFYIVGQIAAQIVGKVVAEHEAMVKAEEERRKAGEGRERNFWRKNERTKKRKPWKRSRILPKQTTKHGSRQNDTSEGCLWR